MRCNLRNRRRWRRMRTHRCSVRVDCLRRQQKIQFLRQEVQEVQVVRAIGDVQELLVVRAIVDVQELH
eukprot:2753386-Heterocapsa_arctica.AAC.1